MLDPSLPLSAHAPSFERSSGLQPGRWVVLCLLFAVATSAWLAPMAHLALLLVNLLLSTFVLGLQALLSCLPRRRPAQAAHPREPFVSIHVPAHNEPPDVLIETLRSLERLDWPGYEVLVIDNNTTDPALWRPVEEACRALGPRFRFLHVEGLAGFKAGAMNWARPYADPRTEYVFVVDADYQVTPDVLRRAFAHVTSEEIALVQFPQAYRNLTQANAGVGLEFRHFFASYMHFAQRLGCVPSTGTLSLISLKALRAVGGFDTEVVTEDSELGFRLARHGYRAVYVDQAVGTGLMPFDLQGIKQQRWRWAFGNAQVLRANWRGLLFGAGLSPAQRLGFFAHSTSWFNFNVVPTLSLLALATVAAFGELTPAHHAAVHCCAATLASFLVLRFVTLAVGLRRDREPFSNVVRAYVTHVGLGWLFSTSWLSCIWDPNSPFVRTNKFIASVIQSQLRWALAELAVAACMIGVGVTLASKDLTVGPMAALAFASARFGILWVWRQGNATWALGQATAEAPE